MFSKPPDRLGEGFGLRVLAYLNELLFGITVLNARDILFDDRTFIQVSGYEVGSSAYEFHSSGVSLSVGVSTFEPRKE